MINSWALAWSMARGDIVRWSFGVPKTFNREVDCIEGVFGGAMNMWNIVMRINNNFLTSYCTGNLLCASMTSWYLLECRPFRSSVS